MQFIICYLIYKKFEAICQPAGIEKIFGACMVHYRCTFNLLEIAATQYIKAKCGLASHQNKRNAYV